MAQAPTERRVNTGAVELREAGESRVIVGYGAVFGEETVIPGFFEDFRERIEPGAFDSAITTDDVRALFNHDPNYVLGRNKSGTLRLAVDGTGLRYEIDPPNTSYANDLRESVRRGDVSQSSFAFRVLEEAWEKPTKRGDLPLRKIQKVELFDVSPVTYPAYEGTSVSARAKEHAKTLIVSPEAEEIAAATVFHALARGRSLQAIAEAECSE